MHQATYIRIGLLHYPGAMDSALQGLSEMFLLANRVCARYPQTQTVQFKVSHWQLGQTEVEPLPDSDVPGDDTAPALNLLIVPPSIDGEYYLDPSPMLLAWLNRRHQQGVIVCSVCAGAFILAAAGLLDNRKVTTHWNLSSQFAQRYPHIALDSDRVLINDGDIITAGGLMAWLDLGLELVAQFTRPTIMTELGKLLVIDTGQREQRYYKKFIPPLDHGNAAIVKAQHYIQHHYRQSLSIKALAEHCHVGERTFLRSFAAATGLKPTEYVQNVRIQQARELLETTTMPVEQVAFGVGYEDTNAFRKIFKRLTGLTPREFRARFGVRQAVGDGRA